MKILSCKKHLGISDMSYEKISILKEAVKRELISELMEELDKWLKVSIERRGTKVEVEGAIMVGNPFALRETQKLVTCFLKQMEKEASEELKMLDKILNLQKKRRNKK